MNWDAEWKEGVPKGSKWDIGRTEACLIRALDMIHTTTKEEKSLKALVPGCGRGYAVLTLAEFGYHTIGLDVSQSAINEAKTNASTSQFKERCFLSVGDFFDPTTYNENNKAGFDVVFDSTFLCAIPPKLRMEWAKMMHSLLSNRHGHLIMNVFPISDQLDVTAPLSMDGPFGNGPPFRVSEAQIKAMLEPLGFQLVVHERIPSDQLERRRFFSETNEFLSEALMVWRAAH